MDDNDQTDQVAQHHSLTSLDLSGNHILPQGGKALATCLSFPEKSSLTRLDLADNHLGKKVSAEISILKLSGVQPPPRIPPSPSRWSSNPRRLGSRGLKRRPR